MRLLDEPLGLALPTVHQHLNPTRHHTILSSTWLGRLDSVHILVIIFPFYSNYNQAGPVKMQLNYRGVDFMYDSMMLILRVCLRFVESCGGDRIVTPFVRFPMAYCCLMVSILTI